MNIFCTNKSLCGVINSGVYVIVGTIQKYSSFSVAENFISDFIVSDFRTADRSKIIVIPRSQIVILFARKGRFKGPYRTMPSIYLEKCRLSA